MTSVALGAWEGVRAERLDELLDAHEAIEGRTGAGRRWHTEPINWAYCVRLVAEFQGFARDLYDESADWVLEIASEASRPVTVLLRQHLRSERRLDRSNPDQSALSQDFGRFGIDLWAKLDDRDVRTPNRRAKLKQVIKARNGIAHDDRSKITELQTDGIRVTLRQVNRWRSALSALAGTLDKEMATHLARHFDTELPW